MPEATDLRKSALDLSAATKAAIRHLKGKNLWSNRQIGERIGYDDGQMIGKVLREECRLLGTEQTMNLSRLASRHGFDEMADLFSAPEKKAVPVQSGAFRVDLCPEAELRGLLEGGGLASAHLAGSKLRQAGQAARRAIAAGWGVLAEIDAIRQHRSGDSMPAEVSITL